MKTALSLSLLLCFSNAVSAQTKIVGRVLDADSNAVANAVVRLLGLDATQTNSDGYFEFDLPQRITESHFLKGGLDVEFEMEKTGMAVLEPANRKIRLPHNWTYQDPFTIILAKKGSLLFTRSESVLELILREKIQAAVETKEQELTRRDVPAEKAQEFGLSKDTLLAAIADYKDRLRTGPDLNQRGLAALDDANEAREYRVRQPKLAEAKQNFHEAIRKDERDAQVGRVAEAQLPEAYYNLGMTYFNEARYDSAAHFFAKADSLAPDDSEKMNMLGRALYELARYDEALSFFDRALIIDSTAFGSLHPNVAIRLNNIAAVLKSKGNYAGALEKYQEALKIDEAYLGRNHPNVARELSNIAGVLQTRTEYSNALAMFQDALKIVETTYGRNHPNVATGLNNIAGVLLEKGDYTGALEKFQEALVIDEGYFGRNHPKVATRLNNLAAMLREKGDYAGALEKYEEALGIDEVFFGRNHPNVAGELNNIASVLESMGDNVGALEKYQEALTIVVTTYGREHPVIATGLNNIGFTLQAKGDYAGALEKHQEALRIDEAYFGRNHPNVARELNNFAGILESKGDNTGALEKYQEALRIFEHFLGPNHPNTQTVRKNLQRTWQHSLSQKERWHWQTQTNLTKLQEASMVGHDSLTLALLNQVGVGYIKQEKADSAVIYLQQALPLAQKLHDQGMLGTLYNNLGAAFKLQRNWSQAQDYLHRSINHNRAVPGDSAAVLAYSYFHLAGVHLAQSHADSARIYAQKSLGLATHHQLAELQDEVKLLVEQLEQVSANK